VIALPLAANGDGPVRADEDALSNPEPTPNLVAANPVNEEAPGKTVPNYSMVSCELATPFATPERIRKRLRGVKQWRRRESNPGPKTPCSCLYVRSRRTISPRIAPIGGLSPALASCFVFASRPGARRSASQLAYALPEALAGLSVGRLSDLLFRQREQLRYRSQLGLP
jgi:hypothetical protein